MIKEIVIVVKRNNRYSLYSKDEGIYISAYDDEKTAIEHANKENVRMNKYRKFFKIIG